MATWVDPVDNETDPDAPLTAQLGKRWDNNVIAMAQGAPGAPNMHVGLAASLTQGGVGTLAFAQCSLDNVYFGDWVSGSTLTPTSAIHQIKGDQSLGFDVGFPDSSPLSGTWMCLGNYTKSTGNTAGSAFRYIYGATLWARKL